MVKSGLREGASAQSATSGVVRALVDVTHDSSGNLVTIQLFYHWGVTLSLSLLIPFVTVRDHFFRLHVPINAKRTLANYPNILSAYIRFEF